MSRTSRALGLVAAIFVAAVALARAGCSPNDGRRRPDARGPRAPPGSCEARRVARDRRPAHERGHAGHRRAPAPGRQPGRHALLRAGRPAEPLRQALHAVCPAAVVRSRDRGRLRRRRQARRQAEGRVHGPRDQPARHRGGGRPAGRDRVRDPAAGGPEQRQSGPRPAHRCRPPRKDRGLVVDGPPDLAGRRLEPADRRPGRGPPWLAGPGWPPDRRRRNGRPGCPVRVPRRNPPLPPDHDGRRRRRVARLAPGGGPRRRNRRSSHGRRADRRPGAGDVGRPRRGRRPKLRQRLRDGHRPRPDGRLDGRIRSPPRPSGETSSPRAEAASSAWATTARSSAQ